MFFDGEGAFMAWTATDSIYGARSVPSLSLPPPPSPIRFSHFSFSLTNTSPKHGRRRTCPHTHPKCRLISASTPTAPLPTIEHLVLLDVLGAPHPLVRSYFPDTAWLFDVLVSAETRLRDAGFLDAAALGGSFFHTRAAGDISLAYMGDDHLPFLHRGVSVVHVIAEPFPHLWHTLGDDATVLDLPSMRAWNLIDGSSFACSSQSIWGCALNHPSSAKNHHPRLILLSQ